MHTNPKVTQYMSAKVIFAKTDDGIRETFFRMKEHEVRHMPVVDANNHLLGIISDRDIRRPDWVDEAPDLSHQYHIDDSLCVADLMSKNVVVVHTYDRLIKAAKLLAKHRYGALPVVDKNTDVVGILSVVDLLIVLQELLDYSEHSS